MLPSLIVFACSFLPFYANAQNNLQKRASKVVKPSDYKVSIDKYYNSWADKQEDTNKSFDQVKKASEKYLMLSEKSAVEIAGKAWSHYHELNDLKGDVKELQRKKMEADYKLNVYKKLSEANLNQGRTDLPPVIQTALFEAYQLKKWSKVEEYVAWFLEIARQSPHVVEDTIRHQFQFDSDRRKTVKKLQAAYLTGVAPEYFDLPKFEDKKNAMLVKKTSGVLEKADAEVIGKNQRNYHKATLKCVAIDALSVNAARDLTKVYQKSSWRHEKDLREGIQRIKLMQAKQEKWTEAAIKAGANDVPPSPYIVADPGNPEIWEMDHVGQSSSTKRWHE